MTAAKNGSAAQSFGALNYRNEPVLFAGRRGLWRRPRLHRAKIAIELIDAQLRNVRIAPLDRPTEVAVQVVLDFVHVKRRAKVGHLGFARLSKIGE